MAVFINSTNIRSVYGAIIVDGGYNGLLEWPASKDVDSNDWHEYDGIEPDLSELRLSSRSFSMKFGLLGDAEMIAGFYAFLNTSPTLTFNDTTIGLTRVLRVESMSSFKHAQTFQQMQVKFSCDEDIFSGYTRQTPVAGPWGDDPNFRIDGTYLTAYGVKVLKGTYDNVLKVGDVKKSLLRSISTLSGAEYDKNPLLWDDDEEEWVRSGSTDTVHLNSVQVTLTCGMVSPNFTTFWKNYYTLLYDLIHVNDDADDELKACQRTLHVSRINRDLPCYYKKMSVKEFSFGQNQVWLKFSITLEIVGAGAYTEAYLATEDNYLVQTEDGYLIWI